LRHERVRRAQSPQEAAEAIRAALGCGVPAVLQGLISSYHPIDIAMAMRELNTEQREAVFGLLSPRDAGVVLGEVDDDVTVDLASATDDRELAEIIDTMPPDVGADVVGLLDEQIVHRILERIPEEEAEELQKLRQYPPDTAGGLMTPEAIHAPMDVTAGDVIKHIRTREIPPESLLYIYVVDDNRVLRGVIDMVELVTADLNRQLQEVMVRDVVSVTPDVDQAEAVRLVDQYDLSALPVVNEAGQLLGQVTVDDIIDALQREHTEDIAFMSGTSPRDILAETSIHILMLRLPWLAICFLGTLVSAWVITGFEETLKTYVQLAAFIPVVAATSGNAGLQSATIAVRSLALGYLQQKSLWRVLVRQFAAGLMLATAIGLATAVAGYVISGHWQIGLIVCLAMIAAVTWGSGIGAMIPLIFDRLGIDPAVASGPLVTTLNDAVSILIYMGLASALLRVL
jgi:magnesium transporter